MPNKKPAFWRLMSRVKIPSDPNLCWEIQGAKTHDGYGIIRGEGERLAHRVAYTLAYGPIPKGMCVLHSCDNPACVNVNHHFLGTRKDNNADRAAKGRSNTPSGERHHNAKLTVEAVLDIRHMYSLGHAQKEIGKKHGIPQATVSRIVRRESWKHVH